MANYESSNDKIKIAYPNIIVDVVAILAKGINIEGKKIAPFQVELYYQKRRRMQVFFIGPEGCNFYSINISYSC